MEVKKLIRKPLLPARPIRRGADKAPLLMVNFQAKIMDCCKEDIKDNYALWCSFGQLNGMLKDPVIPEPPNIPQKEPTEIKRDRITYSRDFLIQLSNLPVSKQKPKCLPEHPIVLEHPLSSVAQPTAIWKDPVIPEPMKLCKKPQPKSNKLCDPDEWPFLMQQHLCITSRSEYMVTNTAI
ncbi:uncharacterized protein C8orf88 homolog [Mantella aurantiaca]